MKVRGVAIVIIAVLFGLLSPIIPDGVRRASAATFTNATSIVIPASGTGSVTGAPATLYPSPVVVTGLTGTVSRVEVTLNNFSHGAVPDVDIMLVSPSGARLVIMSDVGNGGPGASGASGLNITLRDAAISSLPETTPLTTSLAYQPKNVGGGDVFPAPAPATPNNSAPAGTDTFASTFNGTSPNGTWSLYVVDDADLYSGSIADGWTLTVISGPIAPIWTNIPGAASGIAARLGIFALGTATVTGGHLIYKYNAGPTVWDSVPGAAEVLALQYEGSLWAAQNAAAGYGIYRYNSSTWTSIPGAAVDLASGLGPAYALSTQAVPGGYLIYYYVGGSQVWQSIPGAAAQIALADDGALWARQTNNDIYRYLSGTWTSVPGKAVTLAAGQGQVYALGTTPSPGGYQIYRYIGGAPVWQGVSGAAVDIAIDGGGGLWAIQDAAHGNAIYRCSNPC